MTHLKSIFESVLIDNSLVEQFRIAENAIFSGCGDTFDFLYHLCELEAMLPHLSNAICGPDLYANTTNILFDLALCNFKNNFDLKHLFDKTVQSIANDLLLYCGWASFFHVQAHLCFLQIKVPGRETPLKIASTDYRRLAYNALVCVPDWFLPFEEKTEIVKYWKQQLNIFSLSSESILNDLSTPGWILLNQ